MFTGCLCFQAISSVERLLIKFSAKFVLIGLGWKLYSRWSSSRFFPTKLRSPPPLPVEAGARVFRLVPVQHGLVGRGRLLVLRLV